MANEILTAPRTILDRPFLPRWQKLAAAAIDREMALFIAITFIGFMLRIWDVGFRAMHHDESLHAYYSWQMYTGKGYSYDPLMHGPFQFELVPVFYLLFGVSEFSSRMLAVILGTALIALPYLLRRYLTSPGAMLASVMLAISPAMVYFSRFIRDDIYLAAFGLLLFIAIVRYLEDSRPIWLYIVAASAACAMATMEAAYLLFFIFGSFLIFEGIREWITGGGPVLVGVRAVSLDVWLTALAIFVVLTVLFYSTFFTNPYGIWDPRYPLLVHTANGLNINPARMDILGGLGYWHAQQYVDRGGQPWFYYLLVLPLYEQLALLFGAAGIVLSIFRRSLVRTFLVWWAIVAFALYSWAGEKMPWLSIHLALPLILLGGLFLGEVLRRRRTWEVVTSAVVFVVLLAVETHSTFALNYVDGANPTEMLVYVQTSQDVPTVVNEIKHMASWPNVTVGLDSNDLGGWPFEWYLRDDTAVTESTSFTSPVCGGQYCQVLLMLDSNGEYTAAKSALQQHYVVQRYRWNWWFPEDYKVWFPLHWGAFFSGHGSLSDLVGTSQDWSQIWNWLVYRKPFGLRGARWMYVAIRRDLVPGASKYFPPQKSQSPAKTVASLPYKLGPSTSGSPSPLSAPWGISVAPNGTVYVADSRNHRIVAFSPSGREIREWGSAGTGPGRFSANDSPLGVSIANSLVYVADTWNQRIEEFTASGKFVRQFGGGSIGDGPGQFYGPRSVAVAPNGHVYVADTGNKRIQVFTTTGRYLFSWGSAGAGRGQFNEPSSVAISRSGDVYVSDFWNQRIQEFTASGTYIRSWSVPSWTAQTYNEPYLAVEPNGEVLASNPSGGNVLAFTPTGKALGTINDPSLVMPIGVAASRNGAVVVSDPSSNKVDTFLRGGSRSAVPSGAPQPGAHAPASKNAHR